MTTSPEDRAEVKRLVEAEHFSVNAAAQAVGIHHDTAKNVLEAKVIVKPLPMLRDKIIDPYLHIIEDSLKLYPKLRSTRIYLIIKDRGFPGGINTVRRCVKILRPRAFKAFLPLIMLPGEQSQVDWAHFGTMTVENVSRKLSCFVMVLSYSRGMYFCFTFDQTIQSFLRCHIKAFRYFGGISRKILYDNLKSVVIKRDLNTIHFNPNHLEFAGHYRFKPIACNVRSGWEKGRVERSIRYIRDSFFPARTFKNLDDANNQALQWIDEVANKRLWPQDRIFKVEEKLEEEKSKLLSLPIHDGPTEILQTVLAQKLPFIRYDCNDYSIPYEFVGKSLSIIAGEERVRIFEGQKMVAEHQRSYGKGRKIRSEEHFTGLLENRYQAATQSKQEKIVSMIPDADIFLTEGQATGLIRSKDLSRILNLIDEFGVVDVTDAIYESTKRHKYSVNIVAQILYETMNRKVESKISPLELSINHDISSIKVTPHKISSYDLLTCNQDIETPEGTVE